MEAPKPVKKGGYTSLEVVLGMADGLHARPSMSIVNECAKYADRQIFLRNESGTNGEKNCKNIMEVMMISAIRGARLRIRVSGEDEEAEKIALRLYSVLSCHDSCDLDFEKYKK